MKSSRNSFALIFIITCTWTSSNAQLNFTCNNGEIIPMMSFCDGKQDCDVGDEITVSSNGTNCSDVMIECNLGSGRSCFLHYEYICNNSITCRDVTPCDVGCPNYYSCRDDLRCERRNTVCDGNRLNGCPEDDGWKTGIGFQCVRNGEVCRLPMQLVYDDVQDCDQAEDLCFDWPDESRGPTRRVKSPTNFSPATFNQSRCFKCLDASMVIPRHKVCDDVIDCSDLSDECLCAGTVLPVCGRVTMRSQLLTEPAMAPPCGEGQVRCGEVCIERSSVCDGISDCPDSFDERFVFCKGTAPCSDVRTFDDRTECRCSNELGNFVGVSCDGVGQCPPTLDNAQWSFPPGAPEDECATQCLNRGSGWNCSNTAIQALSVAPVFNTICNSTIPGPSGVQIFAQVEVLSTRFCDGIVDCSVTMEDELSGLCVSRHICQAGPRISIAQSQICDGTIDCDDQSDESNCPDRFECASLGGAKISIDSSSVCDFIINCDNNEDELNCEADGRFYCESGIPLFVRRRQVFDGRSDCSDMSDECPSIVDSRNDVFSSRSNLISNAVLRAIVWIMGILAFCGNIVVVIVESKTLYEAKPNTMSVQTRTNHMLILNLALADFLMGVYLLMLASAGVFYQGTFCMNELDWRTSPVCQSMGALVVISSETSVVTMVFLASIRLYAVFQPFRASSQPRRRTVLILVFSSWFFSFLLAFIPFSTDLQFWFSDRAVIPDSLFFENVVVQFASARHWAESLLTYDPVFNQSTEMLVHQIRNAVSWSELYSSVSNASVASILNTNQFIGYYGGTSVCIPRIFASREHISWEFSLFVTIFNFLAFVFVASTYSIIIMIAKQRRLKSSDATNHHKTSSKRGEAMQRRIYRLVVTDFCCWVPISVMSVINFGGIEIPNIAYVISAVVLLPINSALNPLLYSNVFDNLINHIRGFALKRKKKETHKSGHDSNPVGTTSTLETRL